MAVAAKRYSTRGCAAVAAGNVTLTKFASSGSPAMAS